MVEVLRRFMAKYPIVSVFRIPFYKILDNGMAVVLRKAERQ
jgi:hypothetical protein